MLTLNASTYQPLHASLEWALTVMRAHGMQYVLKETKNALYRTPSKTSTKK